jgi:2-octaprenyl-6-methoxyphenol hydroxylase
MIETQAIVVGRGPAGLIAACLLAHAGVKTVSIARDGAMEDPRTVALIQPSLRLLEQIELWPGTLRETAAPLRKLRLVDDTGAAIAAPPLSFDARELGQEAFGWNVPLIQLVPQLRQCLERLGAVIVDGEVQELDRRQDPLVVRLTPAGHVQAPVLIAADGAQSRIRELSHAAVERWSYPQTAIATSFAHSIPHRDVSTEYHKASGPFTTVPLPGKRSSLVWMEHPKRAADIMQLADAELAAEIQIATHGELGLIGDIGPRRAFPMQGLMAKALANNRVILAGEAAHVVPPIGAQGLNMSFRDAAWAAELIGKAVHIGHDPGSPDIMRAYDTDRRSDIVPRQAVIGLMNRSLLAGMLPFDGARALGLAALNAFGPLRRTVMRFGLAPFGRQPELTTSPT